MSGRDHSVASADWSNQLWERTKMMRVSGHRKAECWRQIGVGAEEFQLHSSSRLFGKVSRDTELTSVSLEGM